MPRRGWSRVRTYRRAAEEVAQQGPIRRAQVSFGAMWASESAFLVGIGVLAYRDGGIAAVGVVTAARMAAAALLAPWLATVADRVRRERVITGIGVVRAATLAGAAAGAAARGGPAGGARGGPPGAGAGGAVPAAAPRPPP